jgi:dienelactone hydrolase
MPKPMIATTCAELSVRRGFGRSLRRVGVRLMFVLLGFAAFGACATGRTEMSYDPTAPRSSSVARTDPFPYTARPMTLSNHVILEEETADFIVRFLAFPSIGGNGLPGNKLNVRYYQRKAVGRQSLVIVLPIWGGHPYPPGIVAADLRGARLGNVMLVNGDSAIMDWDALADAPTGPAFSDTMRTMVDRVRTSVIDIRRMIDWAEQRPELDASRIGIIGFSESTVQLGGLVASDPRPRAAVFVMGGAYPHRVLATCYGPPADVRRHVLPRFGWSVPGYTVVLDSLMAPLDVARLGSRIDPARVLMVEAADDDCIPKDARDALWQVLGYPERISVHAGHARSFLAMTPLGGNHVRTSIARFLARVLG